MAEKAVAVSERDGVQAPAYVDGSRQAKRARFLANLSLLLMAMPGVAMLFVLHS